MKDMPKTILLTAIIGALLIGLFSMFYREVDVSAVLTVIVVVSLLLAFGLVRIYGLWQQRRVKDKRSEHADAGN